MKLSDEQSRQLDEVVGELAAEALEPVTKLIREFAAQELVRRFGVVRNVPALYATNTQVHMVTEQTVANELASRLAERIRNPHVTL